MAKHFPALLAEHAAFIARQKIFFTASATAESRINLSPREASCVRVLDEKSVCYLDQTGSGAETAAHAKAGGRLTLMFCSFEKEPLILRLYGSGRRVRRGTAEYETLLADHFGGEETPGARQIMVLAVQGVQTSCGYGVPFFDFVAERRQLRTWAGALGEDGLEDYRRQKNAASIDGLPTGLAGAEAAE